jgi:hypothetical protein
MHLLTLSQVSNYQINCKRIKLYATKVLQSSFKDYIMSLMEPFNPTLKLKNIVLTVLDHTFDDEK